MRRGPGGDHNIEGKPMLDILASVLGAGGILLLAGYAALCDRI